MEDSHHSRKSVRASLAVILIASVVLNLSVVIKDFGLSQTSDTYSYRFVVDNNGSTLVTITYTSSEESGSSWVIVPKFLEFTNQTLRGRILDFSLGPTTEKLTTDYYFYSVLDFSFASDGHFEMITNQMDPEKPRSPSHQTLRFKRLLQSQDTSPASKTPTMCDSTIYPQILSDWR